MTPDEAREFGTSRTLMVVHAKTIGDLSAVERDVSANRAAYAEAIGTKKAAALDEAIAARRPELSGGSLV